MVSLKPLAFALIAGCFVLPNPAIAGNEEQLIQLLQSRQCLTCLLTGVDLADLIATMPSLNTGLVIGGPSCQP